ncbi:MAG: sugar ABC transporter permease [Chloroflexota bacterium]
MSTMETAGRYAAVGYRRRRSPLGRDWQLGYAMVLPVVAVILGLIAYPLGYSFWLSLHDIKLGGEGRWVGLGNYYKLLFDDGARIHRDFLNSAKVTLIYVGGALCFKFVVGLITALILNAEIKGRGFFRALLFLPWSVPGIVSAYSWKWIFNDVNGLANNLLIGFGLISAPILFLGDPMVAMWSVLVAATWQGTPFWTMTILAGLQSIPSDVYEAAEIDGASTAQSFQFITLPLLTPVFVVTFMLSGIFTTNAIQTIYILTAGGPANATETFPLLALSQGMRAYDLGIASTVPLLFFPLFGVMIYFLTRRMLRTEG